MNSTTHAVGIRMHNGDQPLSHRLGSTSRGLVYRASGARVQNFIFAKKNRMYHKREHSILAEMERFELSRRLPDLHP